MSVRDWQGIREAWSRDGFARIGPVLTRGEAAALGDHLSAAASKVAESDSPYGVLIHNVSKETPACHQLIDSGRLAEVACGVLDLTKVLLFQDLLIWKQARTASDLAWHQDYSYWPLRYTQGGMLWIALDDAHEGNGCMHYVPGSHHRGERRPTPFSDNMPVSPALAPLDLIDTEQAAREAVPVPVAAGEAIMHHPLVWHMSPTNTTKQARRAWATTWLEVGAVWDTSHANHPYNYTLRPADGTLVRGPMFEAYGPNSPDSPDSHAGIVPS